MKRIITIDSKRVLFPPIGNRTPERFLRAKRFGSIQYFLADTSKFPKSKYQLWKLKNGTETYTDEEDVEMDTDAILAKEYIETGKELEKLLREKTRGAYAIIAQSSVDAEQEDRYSDKEKNALETVANLALEARIRGISKEDLQTLVLQKAPEFKEAKKKFNSLIEAYKAGVNIEREKRDSADWDKVWWYLSEGDMLGQNIDGMSGVEILQHVESEIERIFGV